MQIQEVKTPQISFQNIQLTKVEQVRSNKLLAQLANGKNKEELQNIKMTLFEIFDKKFQYELTKYSSKYHYKDDFIQRLYLKFFEMLEQICENLLEPCDFIDSLNKIIKPGKEEKRGGICSLDSPRIPVGRRNFIDTLAGNKRLVYSTPRSPIERQAFQLKTQRILNDEILTDNERKALEGKSQGKTFVEISEEEGKSRTMIRHHYLVGLMKLKQKNNNIPKNVKELADAMGISEKAFIKMGLRLPQLFSLSPDILRQKILTVSEVYGISEKKAVKAIQRTPQIITYRREKLEQLASDAQGLLGISRQKFIKMWLKQPQLFIGDLEVLSQKIKSLSENLDTTEEKFISSLKSQPQILSCSVDTIKDKILKLSEILGLSVQEIKRAVLKQPVLICSKPQTIKTKVEKSAKKMGLPIDEYLKAALRMPNMFYQKPTTLGRKAKENVKALGLSENDYAKVIRRAPSLCSMNASTLKKRVEDACKVLGVSEEEFLKMGLKQPPLFYQSIETITQNMLDTMELFGLSHDTYIKIVKNFPQILYQKPTTLKQNIESSAENFGVTEQALIKEALSRPTLFSMKPETAEKKREIIDFLEIIKGKPTKRKLYTLTVPIEKLYMNILEVLVKRDLQGLYKVTQENYIDAINSQQGKNFHFELPQHKVTEEFIEYVKNFFAENCKNNTCSFAILGSNSEEMLKQNITASAKVLNISEAEFARLAKKNPKILYMKPEVLKQKILVISESLGICEQDIIKKVLVRPNFITMRPEAIAKRKDVIGFLEIMKEKPQKRNLYVLEAPLSEFYTSILRLLVKRKLKGSYKVTESNFVEAINSHSGMDFHFELPDNKIAEEFIEFAQKFFSEHCKNNTCSFSIKTN